MFCLGRFGRAAGLEGAVLRRDLIVLAGRGALVLLVRFFLAVADLGFADLADCFFSFGSFALTRVLLLFLALDFLAPNFVWLALIIS